MKSPVRVPPRSTKPEPWTHVGTLPHPTFSPTVIGLAGSPSEVAVDSIRRTCPTNETNVQSRSEHVGHPALDAHDQRRVRDRTDRDDVGAQIVEAEVHGRLDRDEGVVVSGGPEVDDAPAVRVDDGDLAAALEEPVALAGVDAVAGERDVGPGGHALHRALAELARRRRRDRRRGIPGQPVGDGVGAARDRDDAEKPVGEPRRFRAVQAAPTSPLAARASIAGGASCDGAPIHVARSARARSPMAS